MSRHIFISFTNKDEKTALSFSRILKLVDPEASVFCSAEPVIAPGTSFDKAIYDALYQSDIFIALLSNDYWKSKYCIFELSAAYYQAGKWKYDHDPETGLAIYPLVIPPLAKDYALANTPMSTVEVVDLTDANRIMNLLRQIDPEMTEEKSKRLNIVVATFAAELEKRILSESSLTEKAKAGVWMEEIPAIPVKKEELMQLAKTGDGSFVINYDFTSICYQPSFASLAFVYRDYQNLREYLKFDRQASFNCRIKSENPALDSVTIEFKDADHRKIEEFAISLEDGAAEAAISILAMDCGRLSEVSEICFVVHPRDDGVLKNTLTIEAIGVGLSGEMLFPPMAF